MVTCSFCERTLQDEDDNIQIERYSICPKCYAKLGALVKYFISKEKKSTPKKVKE